MAPIHNPARKDNLLLRHWVRKEDANSEYIFARLNTVTPVPRYSAEEYDKYLVCNGWTKESTDNLMELAQRYDLRWIIVEDRWPDDEHGAKSLDDLRERYYDVHNRLQKARTEKIRQPNLIFFDSDNERRRREQLNNLWMRTVEQAKEEQELIEGLSVIEAHKLERQKKVQDLEKLISHEKRPRKTADAIAHLASRRHPSDQRASISARRNDLEKVETASTKLRMVEQSKSGVSLRSQRTRLVPLLGSNKVKAIEQALDCLQLGKLVYPPMTWFGHYVDAHFCLFVRSYAHCS
ncbi:DMAP1 domain containing protein [Trichuris trichiura]|uniref:DNA methyltransferase 1-associated protein 1 n=1 Tax=Trichuris trichiura TaxID=36087 RepID=A0A077Z0U2_TRITR|nr:DMAP1 domain containing protein [Trichuris trichiura]